MDNVRNFIPVYTSSCRLFELPCLASDWGCLVIIVWFYARDIAALDGVYGVRSTEHGVRSPVPNKSSLAWKLEPRLGNPISNLSIMQIPSLGNIARVDIFGFRRR